MRLTPRRPPGRFDRKALAFEPEIARLHIEGYSREAIRQATRQADRTCEMRVLCSTRTFAMMCSQEKAEPPDTRLGLNTIHFLLGLLVPATGGRSVGTAPSLSGRGGGSVVLGAAEAVRRSPAHRLSGSPSKSPSPRPT